MGVGCLKEVLLLLLLLVSVAGVTCSSTWCPLQQPSWSCTEDPRVTVTYKEVVLRECGEEHAKNLFHDRPGVKFDGADETKTYTIVMADPDAPRHTGGKAYLHWILSGVSGKDLLTGELKTGATVTEYARPTPPKGTGVHRYVTYVYEELPSEAPHLMPFPSANQRGQFDLHEYAQTFDLCGPVAHNMFRTSSSNPAAV